MDYEVPTKSRNKKTTYLCILIEISRLLLIWTLLTSVKMYIMHSHTFPSLRKKRVGNPKKQSGISVPIA